LYLLPLKSSHNYVTLHETIRDKIPMHKARARTAAQGRQHANMHGVPPPQICRVRSIDHNTYQTHDEGAVARLGGGAWWWY
jgi:hypothetical protein